MNRTPILFLNVLIIATCGLVYELLAGTLASYVLGDSVTQFSLIIGIYLFAMGVGAWLSRFLESNLAKRFVEVELAVALVGGASAPLLFLSFARLTGFQLVLYSLVFVIGTLVGLEIPLTDVARIHAVQPIRRGKGRERLAGRVATLRASPRDLGSLAQTLALLPKLKARFSGREGT